MWNKPEIQYAQNYKPTNSLHGAKFFGGNPTVPQLVKTFLAFYGAWHLSEGLRSIL